MLVTSHPPAELIKVAQAEPVGPINDNRVGVRDIESAFDDGRREKHIRLPIDKLRHHLFQVVAVHLAVTDDDARVGHQGLELLQNRLDGHDAVVQEKDLSTPVQLAPNGVADHPLVVLGDDGFHRQPVLRRRLDGAHVACAGEGEVERARDRSGA